MIDERFCEHCGVVLELHPWPEDESEPGCSVAEAKADMIERFYSFGLAP